MIPVIYWNYHRWKPGSNRQFLQNGIETTVSSGIPVPKDLPAPNVLPEVAKLSRNDLNY